MKTVRCTISEARLKEIIREELERKRGISEARSLSTVDDVVDHIMQQFNSVGPDLGLEEEDPRDPVFVQWFNDHQTELDIDPQALKQAYAKLKMRPLPQHVGRGFIRLENKQVNEDVDFEGAKTVVTGASKLLKSVIAFKEDANGGMMSAVTPHLDALKSALEAMVSNPGNYTDKVKVEPKRVKLRAVKDEKVLK